MNIRNTLQSSIFSFLVLILAEKTVLHLLIIMLDCIKSALRKKQLPTQSTLKTNRGSTKNISFQFHYGSFSQQRCSIRSYYYMCVTERGREEDLPSPFSKTGKKFPDFGKKYPDCGHLLIKISHLKCIFWCFLGSKTQNFSLQGPSFLCCRWMFPKVT